MKRYRSEYTVALMSKVLDESSSGYYKWLQTNPDCSKRISELDIEIKVA
jgi:hypothetical protein